MVTLKPLNKSLTIHYIHNSIWTNMFLELKNALVCQLYNHHSLPPCSRMIQVSQKILFISCKWKSCITAGQFWNTFDEILMSHFLAASAKRQFVVDCSTIYICAIKPTIIAFPSLLLLVNLSKAISKISHYIIMMCYRQREMRTNF